MTKKPLTAGQIYYRTVFLKSEDWQNLRIAALAKADAKCCICQVRSLSNDVHHAFYLPLKLQRQNIHNLFVCCRRCHDVLHGLYKPASVKHGSAAAWNLFHAAAKEARMRILPLNPYMQLFQPEIKLNRVQREALRELQLIEYLWLKDEIKRLGS